MKQKYKELLLKDLCARLPYEVKCQFEDTIETIKSIWYDEDEDWQVDGNKTSTCIHAVKPYLFPLSSMTKEQIEQYTNLCVKDIISGLYYNTPESFDWLNKNRFDYRGLIPLDLAKDATGLNIY